MLEAVGAFRVFGLLLKMGFKFARMVIDGSFLLGLLAGEVLFAEVLVTPTGISKGCGSVSHVSSRLSFTNQRFTVSSSSPTPKMLNELFANFPSSLYWDDLCSFGRLV